MTKARRKAGKRSVGSSVVRHIVSRMMAAILIMLSSYSGQCQDDNPQRVLFVGNSYTYFWNLPQQVAAMGAAGEAELVTRQSTSGGATLSDHWNGRRHLDTRDILNDGNYDAVVFQGHSMSTIDFQDSLLYYADLLNGEIPSDDVQRYVYLTWPREWNPVMMDTILAGYKLLAKRIDAQVVPVGLAWELARQLRPGLQLYDNDGSHPSPLGTYLSACVFYSVLTGKSPVGLPHRLITTDKDGEKLYLNIQSREDAEFCQRVAQSVLDNFETY